MVKDKWKLQIARAVDELSILRYFPPEPAQRAGIMALMERFIPPGNSDQLEWLVWTMIDRVGEWHGPVELRGVFCTRYRPADGIEANCMVSPGFTPEEMESRAAPPDKRAQLTPAERDVLRQIIYGNQDL